MKYIIAMCLIAFVACDKYPTFGHRSQHLIKNKMSMAKRKSSRIINGEDADISEFPWQASLRIFSHHVCGAAVIATRTAVTAAHCVKGRSRSFTLKVGSTKLSGHKGTVVAVRKIITVSIHPHFKKFRNDIAILKFDRDIAGPSHRLAKTIAIPKSDDDFAGAKCIITGWGRILDVNGSLIRTNKLQKARTKVLTVSDCKKRAGKSFIKKSHVCVYTGYNGACFGDSGGALSCGKVLVGVTSFGHFGCAVNHPSVYTRISCYRDWIQKHIR
ncbi:transmembrane protease serine 9-like [Ylistrum balloti]|uniref:transmembrane protease serine 9-like n=1 Tax=Ylistrum balloti TaxID=509963 RepID=UPI002905D87F|nr:transmembrane protease serine 9-like [Ylistrum balloti]